MEKNKFSYVYGISNSLGFFYKIQGDTLSSANKKDCEYRIRSLYNAGQIDVATRDYLLNDLRKLKRP